MQCYFWIGPACHMRNWDETFQDRSDVRNQSGQNQCWKQFKPWDCLLNKCCNSCLRCQNLRYVSSAVSILKYATAAYALTDASRSLVDLSTTPALWHQRRSIATKTKSLFISSPTIMKFLHKVLIFIFILQNVIFECSIQKKRAGGEANATRVNLNTIILGSSLKGSSNQRNLRASRSSSATEILRKAFYMSPTSAVLWHLNLTRTYLQWFLTVI